MRSAEQVAGSLCDSYGCHWDFEVPKAIEEDRIAYMYVCLYRHTTMPRPKRPRRPRTSCFVPGKYGAMREQKGASHAQWGSTQGQTVPEDARLLRRALRPTKGIYTRRAKVASERHIPNSTY